MNIPEIALIGAGQFGSRHLQGLALCEQPISIFLVDPSEEARAVAKERFESVDGFERHEIRYIENLCGLPDKLDVAIVATSARFRRQVLESLMPRCQINHLVLEKVLFQSASDCHEMEFFLSTYATKVWVNASRRMWQLFKALKQIVEGHRILQVSFSTAGWGMACNAYHMLDLISWLSDSPLESLSSEFVDADPIPARRAGFYELTGMLSGCLKSGVPFTITDHREQRLPFKLMIETTECCFLMQEGKAEVTVLDGVAPEVEALSGIKEEYQSQLTNQLVKSLVDMGCCDLPSYEEASAIHQIMLPAFAEIFNPNGLGKGGVCPIT